MKNILCLVILGSTMFLSGCGCKGNCDGGLSSFGSSVSFARGCPSSSCSDCCGSGNW